jgi:NADH:ubiquinone oxidoreductase subunit F (NADH-binding)
LPSSRHDDCALAVGAQQGYIYIRGEYPLALNGWFTLSKLHGLGDNILGRGFRFTSSCAGAQARICGEEPLYIQFD